MKTVFFVFNGDPMCFVHVLLNALDMHGCGREVRVVMEGALVSLAEPLMEPGHPLHRLFIQVRQAGLLDGLCRACASKLGAAAHAEQAGIPLIGDMHGHPSMREYMDAGFQIITF